MAPKVKISKERILETSLKMIIEEGYQAVTIKSVAKTLGCSTQPVSWHFGNMDNFREELLNAAVLYANRKMTSDYNDPLEALWHIGATYIDMAINEPNLFRFVYMGECGIYNRGEFSSMLTDKGNSALIDKLSAEKLIDKTLAGEFVQKLIIYTHGIASLLTAGVINADQKTALLLLNQFASEQLRIMGINENISYLLEVK